MQTLRSLDERTELLISYWLNAHSSTVIGGLVYTVHYTVQYMYSFVLYSVYCYLGFLGFIGGRA